MRAGVQPTAAKEAPSGPSHASIERRIATVRATALGAEGQDALQALFSDIRAAGLSIPLDLEERSLRLIARERPNDHQSLLRLYDVLQAQNKEIPEDLQELILKARIRTMVAPRRLVRNLKKIYQRDGRILSDEEIRDICIPEKTYERVFFCFALPKSGSRLMLKLLVQAQGQNGIPLCMPAHAHGEAALAVVMEPRFDYLQLHSGGWFHSHAAPTPPTLHVLDRLQIRHFITLRHPADHVAALYCHLRQLHPEPEKTVPPQETDRNLKEWLDVRRFSQQWHPVIQPINYRFFSSSVAIEDAMDHLINDGYLASVLKWIVDWCTLANPSIARFIRYEDLLHDGNKILTDTYIFLKQSEPIISIEVPQPNKCVNPAIYPRGYTGEISVYRAYFSSRNANDYNNVVRAFMKTTRTSGKLLETYPDLYI